MNIFKTAAGSNVPPGMVEFSIDFTNPESPVTKVLSHGPGTSCHTGDDSMTLEEFMNYDGSVEGMTGHAIPDEKQKKTPTTPQKQPGAFIGGPFGTGFGGGQKQKQKEMTGGFGV